MRATSKTDILRTSQASGLANRLAKCPENYLNPLDNGSMKHKCIADEPEGDHDNPVEKIPARDIC